MSAEDAPERRREERRRASGNRFWRKLAGERRVAERRREPAVPGAPSDPSPGSPADASAGSPSRPPPTEPASAIPLPAPPPDSPEGARRTALRRMLRAAEARQSRGGRRRPVLARGRRVAVVRGDLAGHAGLILDADFITGRVLLDIDGRESPVWVPFSRVGPPDGAPDDTPA